MAPITVTADGLASLGFRPLAKEKGAVLYALGAGPVRGFAVTLVIGILTSVFSAIYVTRLLTVMWFERRRPRTLEV